MGAQPGLGCRGGFPPQLCWAPVSLWGLGWLGTEDPKVVGPLLGITWSAPQPELQASEFLNRLFTIKLFTLEAPGGPQTSHRRKAGEKPQRLRRCPGSAFPTPVRCGRGGSSENSGVHRRSSTPSFPTSPPVAPTLGPRGAQAHPLSPPGQANPAEAASEPDSQQDGPAPSWLPKSHGGSPALACVGSKDGA